jgi:phospholipase D1/2
MHHPSRYNNPSILEPGKTCWRAEPASRASVLIDGEAYFAALRSALLQARRQILIAGWDFDSRIQLPKVPSEAPADTAPEELGELLGFLMRTRPDLEIHVVRWDYHWFYNDDREDQTRARLERLGVTFHDDDRHPVTGCVHHKIVVIDDALAFCGGIDLTHKRWDTCAHVPDDPRRIDVDGRPYMPVHDTQLCVSGPVARALADYLRDNWPSRSQQPSCMDCPSELWPANVPIDFRDVTVGIARTLPADHRHGAVREIENFYIAAIEQTDHTLYLENQYFTSTRIAQAIAARCQAREHITGLLVGMDRPKTQAELHTMGYGRTAFCKVLANAGALERMPLVAAFSEATGINLHSKLGAFDDRWLTVGSANLNRRSMGFDVECNLIIEASTPEHRAQIERIRTRLLAEHLGMTLNEVVDALRVHGMPRLPDVVKRSRHLERIDPRTPDATLGPILAPIFDPESPWMSQPHSRSHRTQLRSTWVTLIAALLIAAFSGQHVRDEISSLTSVQKLLQTISRS